MKLKGRISTLLIWLLIYANAALAQRQASAIPTVINGFVVAVTVTDGGEGYSYAPKVIISGGGGNGALAVATVANGVVDKIIVKNAGSNYTNAPTVLIDQPPSLKPSFSDGLIAYYSFSGNANDETGFGHHGIINGAQLTSDRFGVPNSAYLFNGVSSKISVINPLFNLGQKEYSICFWFSIANTSKTRQLLLLTRTPTVSGQGIPGLAIAFNDLPTPGLIDYYLGVGGPEGGLWSISYQHGSNTDYRPNTWYFLSFNKSGDNYKLFINGQLEHSLIYPNAFNYNVGLNFGHNDDELDGTPWFLDGCLDDIRIYQRALSDQEIQDMYYLEAPEQPYMKIEVKTVKITMLVEPTKEYQLESSSDLKTWKKIGDVITTITPVLTQELDVVETGRYFRLSKITPFLNTNDPPINPNPQQLVWISPGTFLMGNPAYDSIPDAFASPQTKVILTKGFWIYRFPVTQKQFETLMGTNPSSHKGDPNLPVEMVTWMDAVNYCEKLSSQEKMAGRLPKGYVYRLPTDAEWEFACRAGTSTSYFYGDDPGCTNLANYAWYSANSNNETHPVGLLAPNPWGLYDMNGNVGQWCLDWFDYNLPGGTVYDPVGPSFGVARVIRPSGYVHPGAYSRSSQRGAWPPGSRSANVGFRPVLGPLL